MGGLSQTNVPLSCHATAIHSKWMALSWTCCHTLLTGRLEHHRVCTSSHSLPIQPVLSLCTRAHAHAHTCTQAHTRTNTHTHAHTMASIMPPIYEAAEIQGSGTRPGLRSRQAAGLGSERGSLPPQALWPRPAPRGCWAWGTVEPLPWLWPSERGSPVIPAPSLLLAACAHHKRLLRPPTAETLSCYFQALWGTILFPGIDKEC